MLVCVLAYVITSSHCECVLYGSYLLVKYKNYMPFAHIIVHFEIPEEPCFMLLVYLTVNLHSTLEMCDGLYVLALNEFV